MQITLPLKRLTILRAADLLVLFGLPYETLLKVDTQNNGCCPEDMETDNVLTVRTPRGQEYLHVVIWQWRRDPSVLWRMACHLSWFGQQMPFTTIVGTLVYLAPEYDMGDTICQAIDGRMVQECKFSCVRLWEYDAAVMVTSGNVGLTVLSPLMKNASGSLVEQAVGVIINESPLNQHGDLLAILGIFAEQLIETSQFIHFVGRNRLMESQLFHELMKDKLEQERVDLAARFETEKSEIEAKMTKLEARLQGQELQQALQEVMMARFPQAPIRLIRDINKVTHPIKLRSLIVAASQTTDLLEFERLLKQSVFETQRL